MTEELMETIKNLKNAYDEEKDKNIQLNKQNSSLFNQDQNNLNMINSQLDTSEIFEKTEHILRGDELQLDSNNNLVWVVTKDDKKKILNDYGVQLFMEKLVLYVNKNILLGNYTKEEINEKMIQIGVRLKNLVYTRYETLGLDTPEKRKAYPALVKAIVDVIHGTYMRSLDGEERDSLRKQMYVTQNQPLGMDQGFTPKQNKKFSWNPVSWFTA